MKNKHSIFGIGLILAITIGSIVFWRNEQEKNLYTALQQSTTQLQHIHFKDRGLNFKADGLVFYRTQHDYFPDFTTQRLFIRDNFHAFDLELRGINGSILNHLRRNPDFDNQVLTYQPHKDLLNQLLTTLALLKYDKITLDLSLNAHLTAPNQLFVQFNVMVDGKTKMRLISKMTPPLEHQTIWENLSHHPLKMRLDYIDSEWKEALDNYTQSKKIPFVTDQTMLPLNLHK